MRLFLIRHGETVDNLAQVYAGVTDSALTNHGALQADRLGSHFAKSGLRFTKIFSSDLQRAFKTAEAIRLAQPPQTEWNLLQVHKLEILREQDFGSSEGMATLHRHGGSSKRDKLSQLDGTVGFKEVESMESMVARMNDFLNETLLPMIADGGLGTGILVEDVVAIVSHGIILSALWKCLLKRFDPQSVSSSQRALEQSRGSYDRWTNTGYLELHISRKTDQEAKQSGVRSALDANRTLVAWNLSIQNINAKDHLTGLKRTGGGVGSSKFDEGQPKIESFFKKRKIS